MFIKCPAGRCACLLEGSGNVILDSSEAYAQPGGDFRIGLAAGKDRDLCLAGGQRLRLLRPNVEAQKMTVSGETRIEGVRELLKCRR